MADTSFSSKGTTKKCKDYSRFKDYVCTTIFEEDGGTTLTYPKESEDFGRKIRKTTMRGRGPFGIVRPMCGPLTRKKRKVGEPFSITWEETKKWIEANPHL